jgi:hypothetical protein
VFANTVTPTEPATAGETPAPQRRGALRKLRPVWADIALLVVLAGAVIRLRRWHTGVPLWLDEQMVSLNIRDRDFPDLIGVLQFNQSAPLGWLWTEWMAVRVGGVDERVLRFVPLMFGIGTIVVAWWIGRRWLGPVGAVVLTSLCAFTPQFLRYADEVKQYTSDTFWVLLLVALAGWVLDQPDRPRRMFVWWGAAAFALWFSMAAVLVAPGIVLVLVGVRWRRRGWRAALVAALPGFGWLASFGLHYYLALRYAVGSDFLTTYWKIGFPPKPFSVGTTLSWLADRPALLAADPIGTPRAGLFWSLVVLGLAVALWRRPSHGLLLLAPVASAFVLAAAHVVPLIARLALWFVPVLFVIVAVAINAPARALVGALRRARAGQGTAGRWVTVAVLGCAVLMFAGAAVVLVEPIATAARAPRLPTNGVDDRAAVHWVAKERRDGDLVLVTRHSWAAFLWYDRWYDAADGPGTLRLTANVEPGKDCADDELGDGLRDKRRVIFYSGIRLTPYPRTNEVVAARLAEQGTLVETKRWGMVEVRVFEIGDARPPGTPAPVLAAVKANCVQVIDPDRAQPAQR